MNGIQWIYFPVHYKVRLIVSPCIWIDIFASHATKAQRYMYSELIFLKNIWPQRSELRSMPKHLCGIGSCATLRWSQKKLRSFKYPPVFQVDSTPRAPNMPPQEARKKEEYHICRRWEGEARASVPLRHRTSFPGDRFPPPASPGSRCGTWPPSPATTCSGRFCWRKSFAPRQ